MTHLGSQQYFELVVIIVVVIIIVIMVVIKSPFCVPCRSTY